MIRAAFIGTLAGIILNMPMADAIHPLIRVSPPDTFMRIEEDDPRFSCATMGNLVCGADTIPQADTMLVWYGYTYNA